MSEENDLVFLEELKENNRNEKCEKEVEKKSKQTLDLKSLRESIESGLYEPNFDKIAEAFIEEEIEKEPNSDAEKLSEQSTEKFSNNK